MPSSPTVPDQINSDLELLVEPETLLDMCHISKGSPDQLEIFLKWKGLPVFEATWEDVVSIQVRFPTFYHEDKVKF